MTIRSYRPTAWSVASASAIANLVLLACTGCTANSDDARVAVHGTVNLDGKPLEAAAIVFHCGNGEDKVTAFGFVENGSYEIAAKEGPLAGQARVEFQPKPVELAEFEAALDQPAARRTRPKLDVVPIPAQYGAKTTLTVNVTADGENKFDFDLTSR